MIHSPSASRQMSPRSDRYASFCAVRLDHHRNEFFAACLALAPGGNWLEIGCGASACLTQIVLRETERTVVALEASEKAAETAVRRLRDGEANP